MPLKENNSEKAVGLRESSFPQQQKLVWDYHARD